MSDDANILPADIHKTIVTEASYQGIAPRKGDEVGISYTGTVASDGRKFDSSPVGQPFLFKLGVGEVMEGWDRVVATMKKGEKAQFRIPEMYLNGGATDLLDKLPDDCDVIYEMELVSIRPIDDLFGDGGVIQSIERQDDKYAKAPKAGDEVLLNYELVVGDDVVDRRTSLEHKIGFGCGENMISSKVLDKALLGIKRQWAVSLRCRPDYAFGEAGNDELGVAAGREVTVRLVLEEIYETEDAGKKIGWGEGVIVKKAIRVVNNRSVPGMDGTRCSIKVISVNCGSEEESRDETFEFVPGDGTMCDALECACSRMRKGEVALVTVRGPASLLSPGRPEALKFDGSGPAFLRVEMVAFDRPPLDDGPNDPEERLRFCAAQKERGSGHFRQGRVRLAQERYARVLELLPRYKRESGTHLNMELFESENDRQCAQELRLSCRLNLAACALKLEEFYAAARYCDMVLKDDSSNVKALYRHAQACAGTKDFDAAVRDCKRILELEEGHKEAQAYLHKIVALKKEESKRQKAQFAGKFS